jgi:hypothetical protein
MRVASTKKPAVSEDNKAIANHLAQVFSSPIKVHQHWDEPEKHSTHVFYAPDKPVRGVVSYGTIGLSDHQLHVPAGRADFGLELVAACDAAVSSFPDMLATAALCVGKDQWQCYSGAIFNDIVRMYGASKTMSNLCFVDPFLWDDPFLTWDLSQKKVAWLQAIPISDAERDFADEHGFDQLRELFLKHQIDVCDIGRASVV